MSRGTRLDTIRGYLLAELGDTQETNSSRDTEYNYRLSSKQKDLSLAYDWPFLEHKWDLSCTSATRYFNIPTSDIRSLSASINFERPVKVERSWNSFWNLVEYGISSDQYNYINSDASPIEKLDPIQRWQLVTNPNETSNPDQIEVWPPPSTTQTLRFTGQRVVQTLSSDTDKADLDDFLLVYFTAAEILALRNMPNAPIMLKKASDHLIKLRAGYPAPCSEIIFGRHFSDYPVKRLAPIIAVA